jgi:hypothetical protein
MACRMIPPIPFQPTKISRTASFTDTSNCNTTLSSRLLVEHASLNRQTILHQLLFSCLSLPHSLVEQSIRRNKTVILTGIEPGMRHDVPLPNPPRRWQRVCAKVIKIGAPEFYVFYQVLFAHTGGLRRILSATMKTSMFFSIVLQQCGSNASETFELRQGLNLPMTELSCFSSFLP